MKRSTICRLILIAWVPFLFTVPLSEAALDKGSRAPSFSALKTNKKASMSILYFFKYGSKPSRKGLEHLKKQYPLYKDAGISIFAISRGDPKSLEADLKKHPLPFPVIRDDGKIFRDYGVQVILPVTYVLSPGGRVTDVLEGGGPTSHHFITTLAQRSLQLKKHGSAKKLYTKALEENPEDVSAQSGLGQVLLTEGKLDQAEAAFTRIARLPSPEAILGKEGLAAVQIERGHEEQALAIAEEIRKEAPGHALVHLIKGNILSRQGDQGAALASYKRAIAGKLSQDWQQAEALNQAGRIHSERGEYEQAEAMYEQAINHNPFSSEILTNRGALYEKRGQPQKALALYREASLVDPKDEIALLLAKRVMQHLDFKEDMARQRRIDHLVADLSKRFHQGGLAKTKRLDSWSSRPMTLAFLGMKKIGPGLLREGLLDVIQQEIADQMASSGRMRVVERALMEQLLTELKLGSSELAAPETALKLGKLFAARLIVTGTLVQVPEGLRLSLRMIDPETSEIKIRHSDLLDLNQDLSALAVEVGSALSRKVIQTYPLRGKIAALEAEQEVILNIGKRHGVLPGMEMKIIAEGEAIVIGGKTIGHRKRKVGRLEITEVEEGLSYGHLTEQKAKIEREQKVLESEKTPNKNF